MPCLALKGELGELQIYFIKIPLHQQKFSVISVLSNSLWLPRNLKNIPNETTKLFLFSVVVEASYLLCLLRDDLN